jgi:hypothetical protein
LKLWLGRKLQRLKAAILDKLRSGNTQPETEVI